MWFGFFMRMVTNVDMVIKGLFIGVLVFTALAFGAGEFWAATFMELGILVIVVLWAIRELGFFSCGSGGFLFSDMKFTALLFFFSFFLFFFRWFLFLQVLFGFFLPGLTN